MAKFKKLQLFMALSALFIKFLIINFILVILELIFSYFNPLLLILLR